MNRRIALGSFAAFAALVLAGCPSGAAPTPAPSSGPAKQQPLVLLVADDPQLGKAIAREWLGRTEEQLTVRDVSLADLTAASRLPGDAIVFPSGLIGQLAERGLIVPLESAALEEADFNYRDIFDQIRLREMRWGSRTLAAPLGSPQLLLVYRSDIFEKAGLEPPADWIQYQQAVERLADRARLEDLVPPADQPWRASIEPLAGGWAGQLLLARAAAYALHREQVSPLFRFDTMTPFIDQPPYVRALEELVAAAKASGFADLRLSPQEAWKQLQKGTCGMALTWATPGVSEDGIRQESKIAFALLPGSSQAFRLATKTWESRGEDDNPHVPLLSISGRMAAVAASTPDPRRAQGFVIWLAGREVSQQVAPHSSATTLFRNSQVAASSRWTGSLSPESSRQYAEVLAQSLSLPRAFPGLTLPGRIEYLSALDEAVEQAVSGQLSAKEALDKAASRWRDIIEKLGAPQQRRANARSLGQGDF